MHAAVICGPRLGAGHTAHSSWQALGLSLLCHCPTLCLPDHLPRLPVVVVVKVEGFSVHKRENVKGKAGQGRVELHRTCVHTGAMG